MKKLLASAIILLAFCGQASSGIDADESIVFFPTYGYSAAKGETLVRIHGWVYEPEEKSLKRNILLRILRAALDTKNVETERFNKTARYFMVDNERGQSISIAIEGRTVKLPDTGPEGHATMTVPINRECTAETTVPFRAILPKGDTREFKGSVICIPRSGVSVITDIDDTVKISDVLDKKSMIRNTFMKRYRAVPGMSRIYKRLKKLRISFHYVSGSPWQLYVPLADFMKRTGFPAGSMHFKNFRLKDRSGFRFLSGEQISYKTSVIRAIINDFPERKFILVGDSGEKDPEVYAAITGEFRDRILAVCIRDVGSREKDSRRYKNLFGAYSSVPFILFKNAASLNRLFQLINERSIR